MNSKDAFARIEAGDYEGTRSVNGVERKSIFREYADSVADGLAEYYRTARKSQNDQGAATSQSPTNNGGREAAAP